MGLHRRVTSAFRAAAVARRCANSPKHLHVAGAPRILRAPDTRLILGDLVFIEWDVHLNMHRPGAVIDIGGPCLLNYRVSIHAAERVVIGADSALSWNVTVTDSDFHSIGERRSAPVSIGERVLIGANATILKGVTIGDGAVVAAGSVVTRDVPGRALVAGNPAEVIRSGITWSW